jgi:hypothetical protein
MENLLEFNNFHNEGNIGLADLFTLNEDGYAAKYSKKEFKKFFQNSLNESEVLDESLIEPSYAFYELSMLYESKSNWLETEGQFVYLDCDSHVMLIKNGEGHLIEKSTFDLVQASNINEGWWSNIVSKWVSVAKTAIQDIKNVAKAAWDTISYGARKAWEFAKTCANAIVKFVKEMTFMDWCSLALGVLAAILGICGGISFGTGVLAWLTPILTVLSGIVMAIGGGLEIYEGYEKVLVAEKVLVSKGKEIGSSPQSAKLVAAVSQTLPEIVIGGGMILMGVHSVIEAASAPVNPAAGTTALATNIGLKSSVKNAAKKIATPGGAIHHMIEKTAGSIAKSSFGKKAATNALGSIATMGGVTIISEIFGGIFEVIVRGIGGLASALSAFLSIPKKITSAIDSFAKSANNTITKILAKGLSALVRPMTNAASKVIAKYFQPTVDGVIKWSNEWISTYKKSKEQIKGYKEMIHGEHEKPTVKPLKLPATPKQKIDAKEVTKKDINVIRKAQKKQPIKESLSYNMIHIKPFII